MKTPWINYEEIKRRSIIQQTIFTTTVAKEQYKSTSDDCKNEVSSETDNDHHELDTPLSGTNTDENHVPDLYSITDECNEIGICHVVKEINENQTSLADDIRTSPIDCFTEFDNLDNLTDSAKLKQAHQIDFSRETDNNLQTKSKFNLELISESDPAPTNFKLVTTDNALESLDITEIIEPSKKRVNLIKFGISQLVNVLIKIQIIQTNVPTELSVNIDLPFIDEASEIEHGIDSQTECECESVDISMSDAPPSYIESDEAKKLLEYYDNTEVNELDEKNSESKHMGIYRLENLPEKVPTIQTNDPCELSVDLDLPDEAAEIDHVLDSQTGCERESVHISISDVPPSYIETDEANDFLKNPNNSVVIELDEKNSEAKQIGKYRLVSLLKKVQTIQTEDPFELSVDLDLPGINEAAEIDHVLELLDPTCLEQDFQNDPPLNTVNDAQTECEFEPGLTSKSGYIDNANERFDRDDPKKIEPTDEMEEFHQCGKIYSKTIKSPFSTFVEIKDFLHAPIFGEISQNTFEFLDPSNTQSFQLDTKLINTSTYYPELPSCHLVSSAIHEIIYLSKSPLTNGIKKHKNNSSKSIMIPVHLSSKTGEPNHANYTHDFIKICVPVVVGEYNIEICIEEEVLFEEKDIRIKEITKNVVLTKGHFTPTQFSKPLGDGTCAASNGMLSIEGFIVQNIEYTAMPDKNKSSIKRTEIIELHEKITLELMVQLLQKQGIRVNYYDIKNYKNG